MKAGTKASFGWLMWIWFLPGCFSTGEFIGRWLVGP